MLDETENADDDKYMYNQIGTANFNIEELFKHIVMTDGCPLQLTKNIYEVEDENSKQYNTSPLITDEDDHKLGNRHTQLQKTKGKICLLANALLTEEFLPKFKEI